MPTAAPRPPWSGRLVWYFAEGYTTPGFDAYLTIQNPNEASAAVRSTYYRTGKSPIIRTVNVPGFSRYTVSVHQTAEGVGPDEPFSAKVESTNGVGIVVERPMYFNYHGWADGGHNAVGAPGPARDWYFAEGATYDGIDEYLTILNANAEAASVSITYLRRGGAPPIVRRLSVPALSRYTVKVHDETEGVGRGQEIGAWVSTDHPVGIVVERPMYFRYRPAWKPDGEPITGGHNSMGVIAPRPAWYFPDGNTTTGFDAYLALINPSSIAATVRILYDVEGEALPIVREMIVPARSRETIVLHETIDGVGRGKRFSTRLEALNGVGLVAEQATYYLYQGRIDGGQVVVGANQPYSTWLFAEGYTADNFDEYLVVYNPNAAAASVRITYYLTGSASRGRTLSVPPRSRVTIAVFDQTLGVGRGQAVSASVESTNGVDIVAERPIYFSYTLVGSGGGATVDGGHSSIGATP